MMSKEELEIVEEVIELLQEKERLLPVDIFSYQI